MPLPSQRDQCVMRASLKTFMRGIIDYAGLFPPADLALDAAIHNYAQYLADSDAWMLSRFIIPARQLDELTPYRDLFGQDPVFPFSVLGKGTQTVVDYHEHLQEIAASIKKFLSTHGSHVSVDILEIKLPREAVFANDAELLADILRDSLQVVDQSSLPGQIFFEGYFEENWEKEMGLVIEELSQINIDWQAKNSRVGFKIRCGGVEEEMFPDVEQLSFALNRARDCSLPIKCTAGLHHPVRHYSEEVQTKMHGFFNVFGGAMLSYAYDLSDEELSEILNEEDPDHFVFTDDAFGWKDFRIGVDEIAELRHVALTSFGSCSFDEPREDLEKLGFL